MNMILKNSLFNIKKRMKNTFLLFLFLWTINPIPESLKAQVWDSLGTGLRNNSNYNHVHNGNLLVGIKDTINNMFLSNIGIWDGAMWDTLGVD
ncbi:MAG: hypothetical protein IPP71_05500 [Bacteroidetes bacterium]|nr:hypothetical protein [Bacteroidota bacterium]